MAFPTQRAEEGRGARKGEQDSEHELSLLQHAAHAPARLLPQPTVALTTTVTGVKIKVEDLLHVPRWLGP